MPKGLRGDELDALIEISRTVNAHLELSTVLKAVMAVTAKSMDVEASSLILIDEASGDLIFHTATGAKAGELNRTRLPRGTGLVGTVIDSDESVIVNDVSQDARFSSSVDRDTGFRTRSVLCVPLRTNRRMWGAIEVLNRSSGDRVACGDCHRERGPP
jgi:signal transduction protein with GAF and PtsI domain